MAEYIDREAVYKRACRGCTRHGDEFGSCYHEELCEELQSEFASAPIADVEPVRHGRWEYIGENSTGKIFRCSACKFPHNPNKRDIGLIRVDEKPNYCPNCGAKMDEEVKA